MKNNFYSNLHTYLFNNKKVQKKHIYIIYKNIKNYYNFQLKKKNAHFLLKNLDLISLYYCNFYYENLLNYKKKKKWFIFKINKFKWI